MTDREKGLRFARVLGCLNEAFKCDPAAIQALCDNRVPANDKLANSSHIYVVRNPNRVSLLGVLNGVLESAGLYQVSAEFDIPERGLPKMLGFSRFREGDYAL